jgi:pyrroloquinoline quinone (PQQ) biosynthesis protein C
LDRGLQWHDAQGHSQAVAGPGRYAFAAKISQIDPADGKTLFLKLHESLKRPEANADAGWATVLRAMGATEREIATALANPSAEAEDFVEVIRMHGLRSSAVEASVVAYLLERQLPVLFGRLATALEKHYGLSREATAYLRFEAARSRETEQWVNHLVKRYVVPADSYKIFEARRAGREALWAWTVLVESC